MDVAEGHVVAVSAVLSQKKSRDLDDGDHRTYNLGLGEGASVWEVIAAFESASGVTLRTERAPRRCLKWRNYGLIKQFSQAWRYSGFLCCLRARGEGARMEGQERSLRNV